MKPICKILGGILASSILLPAQALEVYQWTDDDGVVHFSQWAPETGVDHFETVSVEGSGNPDNGIGISERDDPEGYQAHREEMEALWAGIEARREAERQARERAPQTEIIYVDAQPDYGYPYLFPGHGLRPPFKPDRPGHRPGHVPGRPGEDPTPSVPFRPPGR